ncbi:hypothetical protein H5410_013208 [Solanum commersonii]|uniref:Uncharacterized protein n=1 Tax=Solanum commersonii TaxID=4109 RepID=A0A9J6ATW5_SOLCO|nr:hypothetical protein H5410_013208 [Solanum commersonii]
MDREQTPNAPLLPPPMRPTVHQDDADEEDETVKQLNECSSVYLSLQKFRLSRRVMIEDRKTRGVEK